MVTEWDAKMKISLLKGPSAAGLAIGAFFGNALVILLMVVLFIGMVARGRGYAGSWFLTAVLVLAGVAAAVAIVSNLLMNYWAVPREVRAGYTTNPRPHREVAYVDNKTGFVIRCVGEDLLSPDERKRRLALIRGGYAGSNGQSTERPND